MIPENIILTILILLGITKELPDPDVSVSGKASIFYPVEKTNNGILACGGGKWEDKNLPLCAYRNMGTPKENKLDCGSWVLIKNERTGKEAWCKVLDRGPYGKIDEDGNWFNGATEYKEAKAEGRSQKKGRWRGIIDMSPAVAKKIGHNGMEKVTVKFWKTNPAVLHLDKLNPGLIVD
jgi:hypothetical protein